MLGTIDKMNPLLQRALAAAAIIASFSTAHSISYVFTETHLEGKYAYEFLSPGETYSNTWNISDNAGFSTSLWFTGGKVEFWFSDDSNHDTWDKVEIDIGNVNSWFNGDVDGHHTSPYSLNGFDLVSGPLDSSMLADVAFDGLLDYSVTSAYEYAWKSYWVNSWHHGSYKKYYKDWNDLYLKETRLTVYAHDMTKVADGGSSFLLLGLGLLSLSFAKHKLRKRSNP